MMRIKYSTHFSGVGAFEQAMSRMNFESENIQACDPDYFTRLTFIWNYGTNEDWSLANTPEHKYFATEITKIVYGKSKLSESEQLKVRKQANEFAKKFSFYYPFNVYDADIPKEPQDIFVSSPPCQSFSLAGKRLGKEDERGILFFNSLEFIRTNNPRYFIFENVKGLLSDDSGRTFDEWIYSLGGKSINGTMSGLVPFENSVPYHIYWKVLNSKDHGVPQNRERVFIVGIRDDQDNNFSWPVEEPLTKRLKDVLESEVDPKYFLSEKAVKHLINHKEKHDNKGTRFGVELKDEESIASTIRANGALCPTDNHLKISVKQINPSKESGGKQPYQGNRVYDSKGISPTISAQNGGKTKGSILTCIPVLTPDRPNKRQNGRRFKEDGDPSFTITTQDRHGIFDGYQIRRLTPRECFRLQDFPDSFDFSVVSDSQAYKQAGNSITVRVLEKILLNLNL